MRAKEVQRFRRLHMNCTDLLTMKMQIMLPQDQHLQHLLSQVSRRCMFLAYFVCDLQCVFHDDELLHLQKVACCHEHLFNVQKRSPIQMHTAIFMLQNHDVQQCHTAA